MIFASNRKLKPGTVNRPHTMALGDGEPINGQPMYIVREASVEEFLKQLGTFVATSHPYYYEMSSD